jgi:hypothetical protein
MALGGMAMVALGILHVVIDTWKLWGGQPFTFLGMNSIAVYMISELLPGDFPLSFALPEMTHAWILVSNLTGVASLMILAFWLHSVKFFLAV